MVGSGPTSQPSAVSRRILLREIDDREVAGRGCDIHASCYQYNSNKQSLKGFHSHLCLIFYQQKQMFAAVRYPGRFGKFQVHYPSSRNGRPPANRLEAPPCQRFERASSGSRSARCSAQIPLTSLKRRLIRRRASGGGTDGLWGDVSRGSSPLSDPVVTLMVTIAPPTASLVGLGQGHSEAYKGFTVPFVCFDDNKPAFTVPSESRHSFLFTHSISV